MSEPTYLAILVLFGIATLGVVNANEPNRQPVAKIKASTEQMCCLQPGRMGMMKAPEAKPVAP